MDVAGSCRIVDVRVTGVSVRIARPLSDAMVPFVISFLCA
jgi:hypothetical protein